MTDTTIGKVLFTAGKTRKVFLDADDADDREFVLDDQGERVHVTWMIPPDEPFVVRAREG
jgi:hypothetical protein